jgi:hypothetical protein
MWAARLVLGFDAQRRNPRFAGRGLSAFRDDRAIAEKTDLRVICATPLGTPLDVQLADLDRFAKEVIPAFRPVKIGAAAA